MELAPDVLVIGGGNAGLCAALSAREAGASVVLLESAEEAWRGGNSKYTRNVRCAHDGPAGGMAGSYAEEELAADLESVTGPPVSAEITAAVIEQSRTVPAWMEARGVRWQPPLKGTLQLSRTNAFFLGGGKALINQYYRLAEKRGVGIAYSHRVERLETDGDACTGVVAGATRLRPRAVVAAAGGFEANLEWLARYWGDAASRFMVRGSKQNDGRPLACLLEAGARQCGDPHGVHAIAVDARGPRFEGGIATRVDSVPLSVMVNRDGNRFYDEGEDYWPKRYATWGRLIAEQPDQIAFSVFDSRVLGRFMTTVHPPERADSIEALATAVGLPPAALARTIATYNAAVVEGTYDPSRLDDCRTEGLAPAKSHWALAIERPPFYAYPLRPGITFTFLGVAVDRCARVLRTDGGPFANVFAAGEIMAGNILRRGYLAGFGMTIGTVFGRIAGEQAARHVRA